jgi:hypothetical protein
VTRADVAVFIGHLQRQTQDPRWRHVRQLNAVVRWMKRRSGVSVFKKVDGPWSVLALPDSSFAAQDPDCLAIRAAVLAIVPRDFLDRKLNRLGVQDFFSRKQPRVCRSTFAAEAAAVDDGTSCGLVMQALWNEIVDGPMSGADIQRHMDAGSFRIPLVLGTDNRGVYSASSSSDLKRPAEPHLMYLIKALRDRLDNGTVYSIVWFDTRDMISDCLTKGGISREAILHVWKTAEWERVGDAPVQCVRKKEFGKG